MLTSFQQRLSAPQIRCHLDVQQTPFRTVAPDSRGSVSILVATHLPPFLVASTAPNTDQVRIVQPDGEALGLHGAGGTDGPHARPSAPQTVGMGVGCRARSVRRLDLPLNGSDRETVAAVGAGVAT